MNTTPESLQICKSDLLIKNLIDAKIITDRLCDLRKAKLIIRHHFCDIHKNAVSDTVIACNRREYKEPQFLDK